MAVFVHLIISFVNYFEMKGVLKFWNRFTCLFSNRILFSNWKFTMAALGHHTPLVAASDVLLCNLNELLTFECFSRHSFYFSFYLGFILTPVFLFLLFPHFPHFTQPLSLLFLFLPFDSFQLLLFRQAVSSFSKF